MADTIEAWGREEEELTRIDGNDQNKLPDAWRVIALKCMVVGKIKEHIALNGARLIKYDELRKEIMKYAIELRKNKVKESSNHMDTNGVEENEAPNLGGGEEQEEWWDQWGNEIWTEADVNALGKGKGYGKGKGKGKGKGACYNCQQMGHIAANCPTKGKGKAKGKDDSCRSCGQMGHWARECPTNPKGKGKAGAGKGLGKAGMTCYKCGGKGHSAAACPSKTIAEVGTEESKEAKPEDTAWQQGVFWTIGAVDEETIPKECPPPLYDPNGDEEEQAKRYQEWLDNPSIDGEAVKRRQRMEKLEKEAQKWNEENVKKWEDQKAEEKWQKKSREASAKGFGPWEQQKKNLKVQKQRRKYKKLEMIQEEERVPEIMGVGKEWKEAEEEWEEVIVTVDSGAVDTVGPKHVARGIKVVPTEASKAGRGFVAANGTPIARYGEKRIQGVTDEGNDVAMNMQAADVKKVLGSVGKFCGAGNRVVFDDDPATGGSYIEHKATGKKTEIRKKNGTYEFSIWVKAPSSAGEEAPGEKEASLTGAVFARLGEEHL
jgi:hypothetical protein